MEDKERSTSNVPEPTPARESQPSREKKRKKKRSRSSPEDIRARKRERRKSRKKRGSGVSLAVNADPSDKSIVRQLLFGPGQLKKMQLPTVFSLLDAPEQTSQFLDTLLAYSAAHSIRYISFDAKGCTNIGLDALVAMSVFVLRARRRRKEKAQLNIGGSWPTDLSMQIMFKASGIPHHLGIPAADLTPEQEKLVHRCELFSGPAVRQRFALARQRNEATESVRKYFDGCLRTVGFALSHKGKTRLDQLISEVIGNAEEHGGPWHTIGHWQASDTVEGQRYGVCHIAMFNFGNSIYESFLTDDASPNIVEQLRSLSDLHTKRGWFELLKGTWDEETLWTLYAMQERVSRFSRPGDTRGNGTRDIVEFFLELGNPGKMCIVSGHAYILFDGKYRFNEIIRGNDSLKIITFNKSGTLEEPPDREYVRRLPRPFPGTMVSIKLTLDEKYLTKLVGDNHG
jgi:hypothetical protein